MKMRLSLALFAFLALVCVDAYGQLEGLLVEKYYISDTKDATDTLGGPLTEGSVTYRIYADLAEGSRLISISGDSIHPLIFKSTAPFFNNAYRGKSFGYSITTSSLLRNTVALDTWLTIGYATNKHVGIPKSQDPDTSILAGVYNDGGSEKISGGLLVNSNPEAGEPLTISDGLMQVNVSPSGFVSGGFIDIDSGDDSTIFGGLTTSGSLIGKNVSLFNNSGIGNFTTDNHILVAQLTTSGELSIEINLEVAFVIDGLETVVKYVARDTLLDGNTQYSKWLTYPADCGCTDPDFLEYSKEVTCDDGSCITPLILGCTDPLACNYNPLANSNVPELCCYNSECALELSIVCPGTVFGCTDPDALNYNPLATASSSIDTCCYKAGCTNPLFMEFDPDACFDDGNFCKVLVIKGCTDKESCNYNPFANYHIADSCSVFGGNCGNKSSMITNSYEGQSAGTSAVTAISPHTLRIYPNPAILPEIKYHVFIAESSQAVLIINDISGNTLFSKNLQLEPGSHYGNVTISDFPDGIYILRIVLNNMMISETFIK